MERAAREKTDRLRYGGLEQAAELGMRRTMCGKNLSQGKECRQSSARASAEPSVHPRGDILVGEA